MASSGKQKHTDQMVGNHFVYVHNERQKQCVSSTRQENNACRLEWFINKIRGRNFKRSNLIGAFEQHDYIIGLNSNASHSLLNSLLITNPPCTSGSPSPLSWQRRRRFRRRVVWHPPLPSTKPWTWWRTARPNWVRRKPRKSHIRLAKRFSLKSCQFSDSLVWRNRRRTVRSTSCRPCRSSYRPVRNLSRALLGRLRFFYCWSLLQRIRSE